MSFVAAVVACLVVAATALTVPAGAAPVDHGSTWSTATVPLANGGIAYDATRDVLLVAVAPSVPGLGNHLVELDPATGALGRSVPVGADPRVVAVADDGSRAYVGLYGSPSVTEVDLATFAVTRQFALGGDTTDQYYAEDIEVQPGNPSVIAVSRRNQCCSPRHEGVAIYDGGVARATETPGHTGANRITWSDDPAVLYGYNNESTGYGFYVLTVTAAGVTSTSPGSRVTGFSVDIEHADGQVHATNGQVVDTSTLALAGSYTTSGVLEVDEAQGKAFFLSGTTLSRHDTATKLQDWSRTVPAITPTSLVDAGDRLVAAGASSILLMGPSVTSTGFALPAAPERRVQTWAARSMALDAEQIVASPDGATLYGVVRQAASANPGRVVEVDVATATITRSLFVGADPHRLAISDDGSTLMVGHHAANQLTEVAVEDLSVRRTIALPADEWADDIAARPGMASSFAVVVVNHCCSPALEGTILVQDGVIAASRGPGHTGATTITFAGDPSRLYGHNGGTTDYGFYTMGVDASGIAPMSSVRRVLSGGGLELVSADGLVFASNGGVVDPTRPLKLGSVSASGQAVPVPEEDRLLMVSGSTINEFGLSWYGAVSSQPFTGGSARDAVLAGSLLAIATTSGNVVLVPIGPDTRTPPTVTAIEPASVPSSGGTTVTLRGSSFTGATSVKIDGTSRPFTVVDDATLTVTTQAHAGGTVPVSVTNAVGTSTGGPTLTYVAPVPAVTSVSPQRGPSPGGSTVVITGSGFRFATGVTFGSTPAASFTVVSDSEVRAVTPVHPDMLVNVRVTTAGGTSAVGASTTYTFHSRPPAVASVQPYSGLVTGGEQVVIRGESFYGATKVAFGTTTATFHIVSDGEIRATAPPHAAGIVSVQVTSANGTSEATPWSTWYSYRNPPPVVTSLSPATGPVGGGNLVAISGDRLTGTTAVRFGSAAASSIAVLDDETLLAVAPPGSVGTVPVVVTTADGNSSGSVSYRYLPAPAITRLSQQRGSPAGGEVITITGTGFTGATSVQFGVGTHAALFQVVSDTRIDVMVPPRAAGLVNVTVTTGGGSSAPVAWTTWYVYEAAAADITAMSSHVGPAGGGSTITITGTGFTGATSVEFGRGTPATFVVVSDTRIDAVVPARAPSLVNVFVTTPAGTSHAKTWITWYSYTS